MTQKNDNKSENNEDLENGSESQTIPAGVLKKPPHPMELLLKRGAISFTPKAGDIVDGTIIEKKGTRVFVDLGPQGTGIIYGKEYYLAQDFIKNLNSGDHMSAKVIESDNEEGYVELSMKDAGEERRWMNLRELMEKGTVLELSVLEANRGGLIMETEHVKGFLPASQLSPKNYPRVEGGDKERIFEALQKLVDQAIRVKILDIDPATQKLIFTERDLNQEVTKLALAKYKVGDEVEGDITGVVDFGAFMKFHPIGVVSSEGEDNASLEGLIHISEIDWTLIEDPRKALKPGDRVRAKIIDIQDTKVSLSLKQLKPDPWLKIAEKYKKGDIVHGRVTKFNPFGVFVELEGQVQGLLHISEFGTESRMREKLEIGQHHDFRVLLIDPKEHRMSLGIPKEETEGAEREEISAPSVENSATPAAPMERASSSETGRAAHEEGEPCPDGREEQKLQDDSSSPA